MATNSASSTSSASLQLKYRVDDQDVDLVDWLETQGEATYPDIGTRTWRVPPVKFNVQKMHQVAPGLVLDPPEITDQESCQAENLVFTAFEKLSDSMLEQREGKALFLIANFEYENYLNKLDLNAWKKKQHYRSDPIPAKSQFPPNPASDPSTKTLSESEKAEEDPKRHSDTSWMTKKPEHEANRGELDGMILDELTGILLLQIKASGYNFGSPSSNEDFPPWYTNSVKKAVTKAGDQLVRDRKVMNYIMNDLKLLDRHMTSFIALPNLRRETFVKIVDSCPELKQDIKEKYHLCLDNFLFAEEFVQEKGVYSNLHQWWTEKLVKMANPKGFNLDMMKRIIFRTVGLLSTVSVWTCRQPRAEVRDLNTAVEETGKRFAQMILAPRQAEILKREDQFFYIWGAAGSGKTLLLSLKGRQWRKKKYRVVILNTRLGSKGRDVGHVIEKTVNDDIHLDAQERALRIDFDLEEKPTYLGKKLKELLSDQRPLKVILDEITWMPETIRLLTFLKTLSDRLVIWCAGMLEEFCPEGFASERLLDVLRCPPYVQRLLRFVDNREDRSKHYKISSARAGLPTDGPRPFFVIHSKHCPPGRTPTVLPYDCPQCAQIVSTFLKEDLRLSKDPRPPPLPTSSSFISKAADGKSKARSSSHGDILVSDSPHQAWGPGHEGVEVDVVGTKSRSNTYPNVAESTCKKKKPKKKKSSRKGKQQPQGASSSSSSNIPAGDKTDSSDCQASGYGSSSGREKSDMESNCGDERDDSMGRVTMRDDSRTNRDSFSHGETNHHKDGGVKGRTGTLDYSDVVLPVTMPIPWHRFNDRGYYCISDEALAQNMHLMGSSVFCTELLKANVPVKIETGMCMDVDSDESENVLIMCPVGKVHGLEYKVVICMPNFCALKEKAEFNEGIFQAKNGPWIKMKRTLYGDELVAKHPVFEEQAIKERRLEELSTSELLNWSMEKPLQEGHEVQTDQIRISTHVQAPPDDVLYKQESLEDSTGVQHQVAQPPPAFTEGDSSSSCSHHERRILSDVNSPRNGRRDSDAKSIEESTSDVLLQTGVAPLEASPVTHKKISALQLREPKDLSGVDDPQPSLSDRSLPAKSLKSSSVLTPSSSSACSASLSAGAQRATSEEALCEAEKARESRDLNDFTEEELRALDQLSDWDKAYVLMSASRCTAQLIMVLP